MRTALLIICIFLVSAFSLPITAYANTGEGDYIHFNRMVIDFQGKDAIITMHYDLNMFTKVYVLLLGSHNLKPSLNNMLFDFEDVELIRIGRNEASVFVTNISRENENYFLHDSRPLGAKVDVLTMYHPDGSSSTFPNAIETGNTFYPKT